MWTLDSVPTLGQMRKCLVQGHGLQSQLHPRPLPLAREFSTGCGPAQGSLTDRTQGCHFLSFFTTKRAKEQMHLVEKGV